MVAIGVEGFSDEAVRALEVEGYDKFYKLSGLPVETFRVQPSEQRFFIDGRRDKIVIWGAGGPNQDDLSGFSSRRSQVALNLGELLLPESNNLSLGQQETIIEWLARRFAKRIPGTKVEIGSLADYADLTRLHFYETGESLFRVEQGLVRTTTRWHSRSVCIASYWPGGLTIFSLDNSRYEGVFVAPLYFPKR